MRLVAGHYVAERYEIDSTLGSGGMAVVYRAYDMKLDRFVTLKVLKEDYVNDENLMGRFPDEARAAAALNHQNIVRIFDHGKDGDIVYIVLEYIEGSNLKEHINRMAPFDDEICIGVANQIAAGLSEAHASGIIHLDIKPQNILVTKNGTVKVTDFGIARVARDVTLKAGGGSMGSVHYFSPEQARGGYIDHKSDIYSLGIVLFEMVTGQVPFDGDNVVAVAMQQINDPLPDILSMNPSVSPGLVNIINKACEKSAAQRYASVAEMSTDLKRAMSAQVPVQSPKTSVSVPEEYEEYEEYEEFEDEYYEPEPPPPPPPRKENKRQVHRKRERQAFLDGEEAPLDFDDYYEGPPPNIRGGILKKDQNLGVINKSKKKSVPVYTDVEKKSDKAAVYLGVIAGIVFMALLVVAVFWGYNTFFGGGAGSGRTPNLVGLSLDDARAVAASYGFEIDLGGADYHPEIPRDFVVSHEPGPNVSLSPGTAIRVRLSLGAREEIDMPGVVGQLGSDVADMFDAMYRMAFGVWLVQEYSDDVPVGHVISQSPPEGTPLAHGDAIELIVSLGPEGGFVVVPNIVGLTIEEALLELRDANLTPGEEVRQYNPAIPEDTIISQTPSAGDSALRDSIVNFVISSGEPEISEEPAATPTPTPSPSPEPDDEDDDAADAPTPTPTPSPSGPAQPTPTPTPTPPPPPGGVTSRPFTIPAWAFAPGTEYVRISVNRQDEGQAERNIGLMDVHISEFPFTLHLEGTGTSTFTVFSLENGTPVQRHFGTVDFGGGGVSG